MVDGFAPRRPIQSAPGTRPGMPVRPVQSHLATPPNTGTAPQTTPAGGPQQTRVANPAPHPHSIQPAARPLIDSDFPVPPQPTALGLTPTGKRPAPADEDAPIATSRPAREKNQTGHAGLAGLIAFILLGVLLLSPLVPGKILQNFPFASSSFSTGDQSLDCLGTQGKVTSTTSYDRKAGAPIVYTYSTSTAQSATCSSRMQYAVTGHTSQFNPLGLVIDIVVALAGAVVIARIWRLIFGEKKHKPRDRKD
jgi:hypothetical protein